MRKRGSPILLRLLPYSFPYWHIVILAWICVAGASAFMVLMPIFVEIAIDNGLEFNSETGVALGQKSTLVWFGVAMLTMSTRLSS